MHFVIDSTDLVRCLVLANNGGFTKFWRSRNKYGFPNLHSLALYWMENSFRQSRNAHAASQSQIGIHQSSANQVSLQKTNANQSSSNFSTGVQFSCPTLHSLRLLFQKVVHPSNWKWDSAHLQSQPLTWNNIPKTDGGHGDKAKIEGLEERPILPNGEDHAPDTEK